MNKQFAIDVDKGLSKRKKAIPSRYFYDARGDKLFQQIMKMPEYYPTNCELEIFDQQKQQILEKIDPGEKFNLVELGAGDGLKTKILLEYFLKQGVNFSYFPVDISGDVLRDLQSDLAARFPTLTIKPLNYEYFEAVEKLNELDQSPRVLLFLGGNIGNFTAKRARSFFKRLRAVVRPNDQLLSGIDLKKNPRTILKAYNDSSGITRDFNLNLLTRINRELKANFKLENFEHFPSYNPVNGECRSYIISKVAQEVQIQALGKTFTFDEAEPIHTEISKKYSLKDINKLAKASHFKVKHNFVDSRGYFVDSLWEV